MKSWVKFLTSFFLVFSTAFGLDNIHNDSDINTKKIIKFLKEAAKDKILNSENGDVLKHYKSEENLSVPYPETSKAIKKGISEINSPFHLMLLNNRDKVSEMTKTNNQGINKNKLFNATFKADDVRVVDRDLKQELEAAITELVEKNNDIIPNLKNAGEVIPSTKIIKNSTIHESPNKNTVTNEIDTTYYKAKINSNNMISSKNNKDIKNILMSIPVPTANDIIPHSDEMKEHYLRRNRNTEYERNTNTIADKVQAIPKILIDEKSINQEVKDWYKNKCGNDDFDDNIVRKDYNYEHFIGRTNMPRQILRNRKDIPRLKWNSPQKFNRYHSIPFYGSYNAPRNNTSNIYDNRNIYKPGYMNIKPSHYSNKNEMNLNKEKAKIAVWIPEMKAIQTPAKALAYNEVMKSNAKKNRTWRTWKNIEIGINKIIADKMKQSNKLCKKPTSITFYNKPPFVAYNIFYRNQMRPKSVCLYNFYPNYHY